MDTNWRPDLTNADVVTGLKPRCSAYFNILEYCRHIGVEVVSTEASHWVARVRKRDGGYMRTRLGPAVIGKKQITSFDEAFELASVWFASSKVSSVASDPYPIGSKRNLNICPIGDTYSVGHALQAYLDWKLLAATKSHFETLVSLVNFHLVPRISHIPVNRFSGEDFQRLAVEVLETPPKFGRDTPMDRCSIRELSEDKLRKRKKTFNALVSILRGAFDMAWERGHLESERSIRALRRLPNVDRPRVIFLDRVECRALLDASHLDLRPLILAALYTGCRANEITSMRIEDFSAHTKSVFVASPKGRRTRHVLLPPEAVQFFRQHAQMGASGERLFRKANGRVWRSEYKSYFQKARTLAGLPTSVTFHGLRHTYASQLLQNGASSITVADQLGHANTQTVSNTYGHLTSRSRAEDIDRCFAPIMDGETRPSDTSQKPPSGSGSHSEFPLFRHIRNSSWPKSNHSRFSGSLLSELRPSGMD